MRSSVVYVDASKGFLCDEEAVILHTEAAPMHDDIAHMAFLYQLGHGKAIILNRHRHDSGFIEIQFTEREGQLQALPVNPRARKPWPARQPRRMQSPIWDDQTLPVCCLGCGVTGEDLQTSSLRLWASYGLLSKAWKFLPSWTKR